MIRHSTTTVGAVPPNRIDDVFRFFSERGRQMVSTQEFTEFWDSLTVVEKDYYLHADLS